MSTVAASTLALPPAPVQPIPQKDRLVTLAGSLHDGVTEIPTDQRTFVVRSDPNASVTVSLQERILNGAVSEAVTLTFTPYNCIQAAKAGGPITVSSVVYEPEKPAA